MFIILGLKWIAVHRGVLAATSDINSMTNESRVYKKIISYLLQKILAKNLENHIQKSGAILEVTNKLHQVRNLSYVHFLNRTPNTSYRIPQYADIEKRQVDKIRICYQATVIFN